MLLWFLCRHDWATLQRVKGSSHLTNKTICLLDPLLNLLQSKSLSNGQFSESFSYDSKKRQTGIDTQIDGIHYNQKLFYDNNYGRLTGKLYPSTTDVSRGVAIRYEYNSRGYETGLFDASTNYAYR